MGEGANKELLLLFIKRFPDGKDFTEETIGNITVDEINEIVKISTLNDYFCNIKELIGKTKENNVPNPKYAILSLDEPKFEIDANTRNINVPAEFKRNGLGVQGDHTAETVYFVIDRYFDTIDLAADDIFIAIQYEGAKDISGLDPAVFKDVTALQNKIVFGWVIDNKITAMPGTIKFAVHFFKGELDENDRIKAVSYSFNTLPASININKAFEFDFKSFDTQRDPSQLVIDRLTNSKADGAVDAMAPIFVISLPEKEKVDLHELDEIDRLIPEEADEETYIFTALAQSPDAGYIEYTWYKEDDGKVEEVPAEKVSMRYVPTKDIVPDARKIYYYKDNDGEWIRLASGDTFQINVKYFERRSCCVVDYVGTYYVAVKNNVGTSSIIVESNKVEVPRPSMPKEETIEVENGWDIEVGYARMVKTFEDTEIILNISAKANEGDGIQYQWYKVEGVDEHDKVKPDVKEAGINLVAIEGEIDEEFITAETGWYTVGIIGTRNNATVEFPSDRYYRITSMPEKPLFIEPEGMTREDVHLPLGQYVSVVIDKLDLSDEVVYHWYKDVEPYGENEDKNDVLLEEFEGRAEITNKELENYVGVVLYCKAINVYNKAEAASEASRRFFILNSYDLPDTEEE